MVTEEVPSGGPVYVGIIRQRLNTKDGHSVSGLMVFSVLRLKRLDQKDRGLLRSYEFSYDHILNHDISSSSDRRETKHSLLDSL